MEALSSFNHGAFWSVIGTAVGYGAILVVMFLLLFVLPYLLFLSL